MENPENAAFEKIADGLAGSGYAITDSFLSTQEVDHILKSDEFTQHKLHFRPAGIGQKQDHLVRESIRGDQILWLNQESASAPIQVYYNRLKMLIPFLNESLFLSLKSVEVHLTSYPPGTFYKRHLDQFKSDDHRKISIIAYLNPSWMDEDGGQLRMHLPAGAVDILPEAGRLVCFRSDLIEHEVLPSRKERLSLTGWIKDSL
jgi:SM-20-related protein